MVEENVNDVDPQEDPTLSDEGGQSGDTDESGDTGGTPSPEASSSVSVETLQTELEEMKRRVSGQTRSWQEERAAKEQAETELAKFNKYKDVIDFSELDEMVGNDESTQPTNKPPATDPTVMNRIGSLEAMVLESNFALANPEKAFIFKDTELKEKTEATAIKLMQNEIKEFGRIVSQPDEILGKAANGTISFINKFKAEGAKSVTEKRQKIEASGADLGGSVTLDKSSNDEEDKSLSHSEYMNLQRQIHDNTKTVILPTKK